MIDGTGNPTWLLRTAAETVASFLRFDTPTLVHCSAGMCRSPSIAAAAIALSSGCSLSDALIVVRNQARSTSRRGFGPNLRRSCTEHMALLDPPTGG